MRIYKFFLLSAVILLLPALIVLLSTRPTQATSSCTTNDCMTGDNTVDDFVQGLFYATGLSNLGTGGIQLLPMGLTSEWTDDYHLPAPRAELAAVSYGNILYAIGGTGIDTLRHAEIFSATTYITGGIKSSGWETPTTMPTALSGIAAAISTTTTGGYLYIAGGYDIINPFNPINVPTSTISYRQITTGGGFTDVWHSVYNALPNPIYYASTVIRNGNLYVVGGIDNEGNINSNLYRFSINPLNGSLGGVITETNQLNIARHSAPATIWTDGNGIDHLYVLGGQTTGNSTLVSVEQAPFQSNNAIGPFTNAITDQLLSTLTAHGAVQSNGRMFVTGGQEGSSRVPTTTVNSALIDPNSNLHLWGSNAWVVSTPLLHPRSYHGTAINSGGEIYVIGGYGDSAFGEGDGTATVYHGSTNGFGSRYAPIGNFVSRVIDLTSLQSITEININSTITGTATMTVQYRYGNDKNSLPSTWTDLSGPLPMGQNVTSTFYVSITASVIQYRATLTSTNPYTLTPILNSFAISYPKNGLPDLTIFGMNTPISTTNGPVTIPVYVMNTGKSPTLPVLRAATLNTPTTRSPQKLSRPIPKVPTGHQWYYVDVYLDRIPTGASDLGDCYGTAPGVNPGELVQVSVVDCNVTTGMHNFWTQVDTCPIDMGCSGSWGFIRESNETNNIRGPFPSGMTSVRTLYLPIIDK